MFHWLMVLQAVEEAWCQHMLGFWWGPQDRKSTRLNSSHLVISYAVFCLKKKKPVLTIDQKTGPSKKLFRKSESGSSPRAATIGCSWGRNSSRAVAPPAASVTFVVNQVSG